MTTYIQTNDKFLVQSEKGIISYCVGVHVNDQLEIIYQLLSGTCQHITRLNEEIYTKTGQAVAI